jgi:hypothetical protein
MDALSFEEMLNEKPAQADKSPEPQDSPRTGEAEQPGTETQKTAEAAPAPNTGQQTGDKPDGATPAPENITEEVRQARAFQRAAEDERKKRQALEAAVNELRTQNAELNGYLKAHQKPAQQPQQPDFLDPEGVQYLQQYTQQALQQQQSAFQQALIEQKVVQSQEIMRSQHKDYAEVEEVFAEAMQRDPSLRDQLYAHPMPAQFAYQEGRKIKAMREIGDDPDAYRARIKDEILAELKASQPQPTPAQQMQPAPTPPPSLAGIPSATARTAQAWQGPTPLDDLFNQPINRRR